MFECVHVVVVMCVRVRYYITAAIGVAATATIVATAASHAPPTISVQSTCTPSLSPQLLSNRKGPKSDPLPSKAQVLRHKRGVSCQTHTEAFFI